MWMPMLLVGCGSSSGGHDLAAGSDLGADLGPQPCTDPNPPAGSICPLVVTGSLSAESGTMVDGLVVSVCASSCFYGSADGSGAFRVAIDQHVLVDQYALELHGRPSALSYYTPLPMTGGNSLVFPAPLPLLVVPSSGAAIAEDGSAQVVSNGDLTLTIPSGTKVLFSVEDFGVPHGHELRVRRIDAPATMPFVSGKAPALLYAISPFEAAFTKPVAVSVANAAGLAAGAAVEVRSLGGLVNDAPPAGRLAHVATAHVSSDGATITTDAGQGITELTWLALDAL
jgi:hypothetical protein